MEKITRQELDDFIDIVNKFETSDESSDNFEETTDEESSNSTINLDDDTPIATPEDFENSKLIDFNTIPDSLMDETTDYPITDPLLLDRENLKPGVTPTDFKSLLDYVAGNGDKPLSIDKFSANIEDKLKDVTYMMNLYQLLNLPMLTSYQNEVRARLYNSETLNSMDIKDLTSVSSNLTKEIKMILDSANQAVQTISQYSTNSNEYNNILNKLIMLPTDKLMKISKVLEEEGVE